MWEQYNQSGSRMYSLNLAAYILTVTSLVPDVKIDETTHTAYFVYPECNAVNAAIKEYKAGTATVNVKSFLSAIKQLRTTMSAILK